MRLQPEEIVGKNGGMVPPASPAVGAAPPATIGGEVIARPGATPSQLKVLGITLCAWGEREGGRTGMLHSIDNLSLLSLLSDGSPESLFLQILGASPPPKGRNGKGRSFRPQPSEPAAEDPAERSVFFVVRGGPGYNRRRLIASLRRSLPAELVQDVVVDGRSWKSMD
jgi:hypothetical protein